MTFRDEFNLVAGTGTQKMFVFDDGIIVSEPSKVGRAGLAFGAIGGVVGGVVGEVSGHRLARSIAEAVESSPDPSAEAIASQVKRARLFRREDVTHVRLEKKGRGRTRKIVVARNDGKDAEFWFMAALQPESAVRDTLSAVFGDRFQNAVPPLAE